MTSQITTQLGGLFNNMFRLTTNLKTSHHWRLCVRGIHRWPLISRLGPVMGKVFPWHEAIMHSVNIYTITLPRPDQAVIAKMLNYKWCVVLWLYFMLKSMRHKGILYRLYTCGPHWLITPLWYCKLSIYHDIAHITTALDVEIWSDFELTKNVHSHFVSYMEKVTARYRERTVLVFAGYISHYKTHRFRSQSEHTVAHTQFIMFVPFLAFRDKLHISG